MSASSLGRNVAFLPTLIVQTTLAARYQVALDLARCEPSIEHEDALEEALSDFCSVYCPDATAAIMREFAKESRQRLGIAK